MKKFIVTTTINAPTEALKKFMAMKDWTVVIVGDKKTPHDAYSSLPLNCIYLTPDQQQALYPKLSTILGWNNIQRRNIGFVYAYNLGADVIATVDDDNIPLDNWGKSLMIGTTPSVGVIESTNEVFDPLSNTLYDHLWHRGYPVQLLSTKNSVVISYYQREIVDIQADLWNGDPDVDAICRITYSPDVKFNYIVPFTSKTIAPFNSQNTFLSRRCFPDYMVLPFIGRMDDIWGAYLLQQKTGFRPVFNEPTVFQARNPHDLVKDMEAELLGYRYSLEFAQGNYKHIPDLKTWEAYDIYRSYFK